MSRLVPWLALVACVPAAPAGPAADPPPPVAAAPTASRDPTTGSDVECLDLPGAPRRRLHAGPDGALWLEQWTRRPEPRGELVRIDPITGAHKTVLSDILSAHLAGEHLVAVRAIGADRSVLTGRRGLFLADLDGAAERPLTPPEHPVASYVLTADAAFYTTPDGALHRRALAGDPLEKLADGIIAVHAARHDGALLVRTVDTPGLAVLAPDGALRSLDLAGDVSSASEHVLIDSPSGASAWPDSAAAVRLPAGVHPLPSGMLARTGPPTVLYTFDGRALAPQAAVTGAAIAEAVPVSEDIWVLVRHDTDADGELRSLAGEADLCRVRRGAEVHLAARTRPRRLALAASGFSGLARDDLSGATASIERGALVLRAPGAGPTTLAALRERAAAVHRAAARLAGGPDLDLEIEWSANHRRASVSWDSRFARPAIVAGGHGLAVPDAFAQLESRLDLSLLPDGRHRVVCRGRARIETAAPRTVELRCAAHLRPGDGAPLASASLVLTDMPPGTAVPFALDLGVHELPPTAALARLFDGPHELSAADPAALADLDDYLSALDAAAALGFAPAPGHVHPAPRLAAPPGFTILPAHERAARAAALWEILAAHADRHHHGRLAPVHLAGTAHTIRRGRLE